MTVAQMIGWLKTQDQDTTVEVVRVIWYSCGLPDIESVTFDPDRHVNYCDKRTLMLGEL